MILRLKYISSGLIFSLFGLSDICPVQIFLKFYVLTSRLTSSLFGVKWKREYILPVVLVQFLEVALIGPASVTIHLSAHTELARLGPRAVPWELGMELPESYGLREEEELFPKGKLESY